MKNRSLRIRVLTILAFGCLIGISIWFGCVYASSETFHHKDIEYLEGKQNNAKALSASASAASVLVSLLPEDTATPLANQISDIGRDFLIVLSALTAEQYLLTITGNIAFCWLVPIALAIMILFVLLRRKMFLQIGVKLAIAGCVLFMLVPVTLRITRLVDSPYMEAVDTSLQQSREIEDAFHYNEDGVVMPGMKDGTANLQTESEGQAEILAKERKGENKEKEPEEKEPEEKEPEKKKPEEKEPEKKKPEEKEPEKKKPEEREPEEKKPEEKEPEEKKKAEEKKPWYERVWHSVAGAASSAADTASHVPGKVADAASDAAHKISDTAQAAADKMIEVGESIGSVASMAPEIPQMAANLLNSLINAFVLMIVTTCVLPLFVLIGMLWITHQILNINLDWEKIRP